MATENDYQWALAFTMKWEKGIHRPTLADVNPTKDGITQRFYDALTLHKGLPAKSVYDLTPEEIAACYRTIWVGCKADKMPRLVACVHFDCSVNMSGPRANRVLQRALGVVADGLIGPKTLVQAGSQKPLDVARRQLQWRCAEYGDLVEAKPSLAPNLKGWINRCNDLRRYVGVS